VERDQKATGTDDLIQESHASSSGRIGRARLPGSTVGFGGTNLLSASEYLPREIERQNHYGSRKGRQQRWLTLPLS
jgi:hypothetical protein